jgi:hypothetical protein
MIFWDSLSFTVPLKPLLAWTKTKKKIFIVQIEFCQIFQCNWTYTFMYSETHFKWTNWKINIITYDSCYTLYKFRNTKRSLQALVFTCVLFPIHGPVRESHICNNGNMDSVICFPGGSIKPWRIYTINMHLPQWPYLTEVLWVDAKCLAVDPHLGDDSIQ